MKAILSYFLLVVSFVSTDALCDFCEDAGNCVFISESEYEFGVDPDNTIIAQGNSECVVHRKRSVRSGSVCISYTTTTDTTNNGETRSCEVAATGYECDCTLTTCTDGTEGAQFDCTSDSEPDVQGLDCGEDYDFDEASIFSLLNADTPWKPALDGDVDCLEIVNQDSPEDEDNESMSMPQPPNENNVEPSPNSSPTMTTDMGAPEDGTATPSAPSPASSPTTTTGMDGPEDGSTTPSASSPASSPAMTLDRDIPEDGTTTVSAPSPSAPSPGVVVFPTGGGGTSDGAATWIGGTFLLVLTISLNTLWF